MYKTHEMKVQPQYYNYIKYGTKRIELRLYDEKRKKINLGDKIKFYKEPDLKESLNAKVIGLIRYNSFEELFKDIDISLLADKNISKQKLLNDLEKYYPKEKQEKYSVIGIRFNLEYKTLN